MSLSREQTYLVAKYFVITFTVLTLIATFVGYGVVLHEMNRREEGHPSDHNYWRSWRAFVIIYLIFEDITAIVGLFGAIKENYILVLAYGMVMSVLWIFNFFNYIIIETNVFNYLMSLAVIVTAFYFAKRIRQRQTIAPAPNEPQFFVSPAVIQVSPSYIPSPSSIVNVQYGDSNAHYSREPQTTLEPQSTPPPPYANISQPKLEFKY